MLDFLVSNYNALICCVGMIILLIFNRSGDRKLTRIMFWVSVSVIVLSVAQYCEAMLGDYSDPKYNTARMILSIISYNLRCVPPLFISFMIWKRGKLRFLLCLPLLFNLLMLCISAFNGIVLSYGSGGAFQRGPLGYLPHIVGIFYLFIMLIMTIRSFRNNNIAEGMIVIYIAVISLAAMLIETLSSVRFVFNSVLAFGTLFMYMFIHVQTTSRDPLSGLLNRASYYQDLSKHPERYKGVLSIDMNNLKKDK